MPESTGHLGVPHNPGRPGAVAANGEGGAIGALYTDGITLPDNTISDNVGSGSANYNGGRVSLHSSGHARIEGTVISGNTAGHA